MHSVFLLLFILYTRCNTLHSIFATCADRKRNCRHLFFPTEKCFSCLRNFGRDIEHQRWFGSPYQKSTISAISAVGARASMLPKCVSLCGENDDIQEQGSRSEPSGRSVAKCRAVVVVVAAVARSNNRIDHFQHGKMRAES